MYHLQSLGRRGHSTTSALMLIQEELNMRYGQSLISLTLTNDMSAVYDTVDHDILLSKLGHYDISKR